MFHQIGAWSIESLFEHEAHPHPGRYRQKDQQGGAPLVQQEQIANNRQGKQERHTTPPKTGFGEAPTLWTVSRLQRRNKHIVSFPTPKLTSQRPAFGAVTEAQIPMGPNRIFFQ